MKIDVNEAYQKGYSYDVTKKPGHDFTPDFNPELTPKQMLEMGIFGGSYFKEVPSEFPKEWFENVTFSDSGKPSKKLNFFEINASQPLAVWQQKGWIDERDPLGWFLWYCRYYQGRRLKDEDLRQVKRWKAMKRHLSQVKINCSKNDLSCRRKQRQALLHWAYDSTKL